MSTSPGFELALRIGFVLLIALIVRSAAHRTISRATATARRDNRSRPETGRAGGNRRHQRANALDSILRNAASVTIFSIALLIIAGDMGLNLAPVLCQRRRSRRRDRVRCAAPGQRLPGRDIHGARGSVRGGRRR